MWRHRSEETLVNHLADGDWILRGGLGDRLARLRRLRANNVLAADDYRRLVRVALKDPALDDGVARRDTFVLRALPDPTDA